MNFITLKIHRPRPGLNPRTLGPVASTLTTRPPRATTLSLLFNFSLEDAIRKVQENRDLELKCTHQPIVYAYTVNLLDQNINAMAKLYKDASKKLGVEVNADKSFIYGKRF
jgi:hypothetical protein